MIYIEPTKSEMISDLLKDDNASWTYEQAEGLIDLFIDVYGDEEKIQWDVIGVRCEFSGYDSIEDAEQEYNLEEGESLEDNTLVLFCDNGQVVVRDY